LLFIIHLFQLIRKETCEEICDALEMSSESDGQAGEDDEVEDGSGSGSSSSGNGDNDKEDGSSEQRTSSPKVDVVE
jgi:hypothetical protein